MKDINRLQTVLLNTGLQTRDNSLYQILKQLIDAISNDSLKGTRVYFVSDTNSGVATRKLTFVNGILVGED